MDVGFRMYVCLEVKTGLCCCTLYSMFNRGLSDVERVHYARVLMGYSITKINKKGSPPILITVLGSFAAKRSTKQRILIGFHTKNSQK